MTGSADDGPDWQPHIRNKDKRRKLANRFKDSKDPFRIVIVRDMWLTGFDAPCLHTMYADKPMQGHGLMQAIARVNRVFPRQARRPGGGLPRPRRSTQTRPRHLHRERRPGRPDLRHRAGHRRDAGEARHRLRHDARLQLGQVDHRHARRTPRLIPAGQEHILEQEDGKKRFVQVVTELSRAFALCAASDEATEIRDDVSFFQAMQAALNKQSTSNRKTPEQIDAAIRQLVSKAITTEGQVIDVFTAAGLPKPDISILERPVPRRSARPEAQERRRRVAGEAAQGRTQGPLKAQPRAEPALQRESSRRPSTPITTAPSPRRK